MQPERVALVQSSFEKVAPIADKAADIFYDRLFEIAPEVRPLFPAEMSNRKQTPMQTLTEHYDSVGAALLYTLEAGLGDDWTSELKDAWTETCLLVAGVMKDAPANPNIA